MAGIKLLGEDEIFDKNAKIILGILVVFLIVLFSFLNYTNYFEKNDRKEILKLTFNGKVIGKTVDYKNHGEITLELSSGKFINGYFPKQKIQISIGDSLVKNKETIYMKVYKNGMDEVKVDLMDR
jgi:hypothetical protein